MTEYGRGPGPDPWHPEDPLYGDLGYRGQEPAGRSPYGDQTQQQYPPQAQQQYPQQYGQQPYPQQHDEWGTGQQPAYGNQGYQGPQPVQAHQDPYGQPDPYGQQDPYGRQDPYGQQYEGGWDTGQHAQMPYGAGNGDPYGTGPQGAPYGNHPADPYDTGAGGPYGGQQDPYGNGQGQDPYGNGRGQDPYGNGRGQDPYGTPEGYPPPRPQRRRAPEPEPETDWDPGPDQGEHAFFSGGDDDDDDDDFDDEPRGRRGRAGKAGKSGKPGKGGKKRRSGCACLVVTVILVGGVGGAGYFGYQFYQDRFGPSPDFAGDGSGTVSVVIPKGAGGYVIGQQLKAKGVVKSVDAFVDAQKDNPKGNTIQDGVYNLKKGMSGKSAVALMLDPKSRNNLIVAEGRRNAFIYSEIDKRLHLKAGTTAGVAKKDADKMGLPSWAKNHKNVKDPLEGFLYPSSYPVATGMKPQDVLKQMVARATDVYGKQDMEAAAKRLGVDGPWEVVTVASLVQAEGKTHDDFRKMSEVVYNRLKPENSQTNQLLQFDSSFNYLKKQSKIDISESEINKNQDPYNTYTQKGLTPGPIGNPGAEALAAALKPTTDGWLYFVATDGSDKTEFAKTFAQFRTLKEKFNDHSGSN